MSQREYLVAFDPTDTDLNYPAIGRIIKESGKFKAWWHHLPFVYMVSSELSAEAISELFRPEAHGARFLVTAVDLSASDGNLTDRGWQWIVRRSEPNNVEHAS